MDIEVLKKNHEPLMHRTYFEAKVVFEGKTPSRIDMIKNLCTKLSSKENMTMIRKINTDYGSERAIMNGYVYEDEKVMNQLERDFVKLRHLSKAEQKASKEKVKAAKQAVAATKTAAKKKK
jgi:ribosomal protein S24E